MNENGLFDVQECEMNVFLVSEKLYIFSKRVFSTEEIYRLHLSLDVMACAF